MAVTSHSEKEIYDGCIFLMNSLVKDFYEYLDFIGVETGSLLEEEQFVINRYPTEIVRSLFLSGTGHDGGASTRLKCRELGIDEDTMVEFNFSELVEED